MIGSPYLYTLYWQVKKSLKSMHFSLPFFLLSQLVWPLVMVGTYYLSYSPLMDPSAPGDSYFSEGGSLFSYLIPGIIVVYLYLEYVSLGFGLAIDRDYGILEPIFLSPVNRLLWLFGSALSVIPSGILAAAGFLVSSHLFFGIQIPHPLMLVVFILFIIASSIPWGALVCSIFLCGRNSRFLYSVFETPAEFLSGSRFPLTALPATLSSAALFYPLSHAINLLRFCWYPELPWEEISYELVWIPALGVLYTLMAVLLFSYAEERGKRDGTLSFR